MFCQWLFTSCLSIWRQWQVAPNDLPISQSRATFSSSSVREERPTRSAAQGYRASPKAKVSGVGSDTDRTAARWLVGGLPPGAGGAQRLRSRRLRMASAPPRKRLWRQVPVHRHSNRASAHVGVRRDASPHLATGTLCRLNEQSQAVASRANGTVNGPKSPITRGAPEGVFIQETCTRNSVGCAFQR